LSVAYNVVVEQADRHGIALVLRDSVAHWLLSGDDATFGAGASIALGQLARIGAGALLDQVFAQGVVVGDARDRLLLPYAVPAWRSYFVAGYTCLFGPSLPEDYRAKLLERLGELRTRLVETRRVYRVDGDVEALFNAVLAEAASVLAVAGAAAASVEADGDDPLEREAFQAALAALDLERWFDLLRSDLGGIWQGGTAYPYQEGFVVLNRHLERLLLMGAIFLWDDGPEEVRAEVPFWSDFD
jgi:hypothetical protein